MPTDKQQKDSDEYLVTPTLLDLHDKYDEDLGLLDEPWADKRDLNLFSDNQIRILGEYIDKLHFTGVDSLSSDLRIQTQDRIQELEQYISPEVSKILKQRINQTT